MSVPTYPYAALGFRAWMAKDQLLMPLTGGAAWQPGVNKAVCSPALPYWAGRDSSEHQAPGEKCHCGFNAYHQVDRACEAARQHLGMGDSSHQPEEYLREYTILLGAIAGKGRIQIHGQGFRCENAQILALALMDEDQPLADQAPATAARYQVPLLTSPLKLLDQVDAIPGVSSIPESAWAPSWLHKLVFKH